MEDTSHSMILGEMRGQLREVVHSLANLSGKFDGLSREVIGLGSLAQSVVELRAAHTSDLKTMQERVDDLKREIDDLKSERDKRTGAANLINWAFRNWPGIVGFVLLIGIILRTEGKL
jgi:septal ring factor EnvC (AmiA/AmiB activator)